MLPMSQSCEFLKIQLQSGRSANLAAVLRDTWAKPRVLLRGLPLTALRNSVGVATYFYVYDKTNRFFVPDATLGTNKLDSFSSFARVFFAGASAGVTVWALQLPVDTLKTMVQAQHIYRPARPIADIARDLVREKGLLGFYRGARIVFLRSILMNGLQMSLFEAYSKLCDTKSWRSQKI